LGGEEHSLKILQSKDSLKFAFPLNYCTFITKHFSNPEKDAAKLLRRIKQATLQYVVILPITSVCAVIMQATGTYCSGAITPKHGWLYLSVVVFFSVTFAMYGLILFYLNTKQDLKPFRPLFMFGAIKFVVFFSFWQSFIISGFVLIHAIKATTYWTADNVASGIQNCLICGEMVIAALLHLKAFPYQDYVVEGESTSPFKSFLRAVNVIDVALDTHKHIVPKQVKTAVTKITMKIQNSDPEKGRKSRKTGEEINLEKKEVLPAVEVKTAVLTEADTTDETGNNTKKSDSNEETKTDVKAVDSEEDDGSDQAEDEQKK